jgi:hypothetical protein
MRHEWLGQYNFSTIMEVQRQHGPRRHHTRPGTEAQNGNTNRRVSYAPKSPQNRGITIFCVVGFDTICGRRAIQARQSKEVSSKEDLQRTVAS